MGKRSRSYSSDSSSDYDSDERHSSSRKRSSGSASSSRRRQSSSSGKKKEKEREVERWRPSRSEQIDADDDWYTKSKEFRHWLLHGRSKPKTFTKMDSKEQKKYFKKFVKKWNRGKLDKGYYDGSIVGDAVFSQLAAPGQGDAHVRPPSSSTGTRPSVGPLGPSRPTVEDLALLDEAERDERAAQKDQSRAEYKRAQRESRQEERENRATGRDRLMEKRAEKRESARAMASAKEQGDMEFGEDYLMGGTSSSFAEALRRRDAQEKFRQRKQLEKAAVTEEKRSEYQKKEDSTMAMVSGMRAVDPPDLRLPQVLTLLTMFFTSCRPLQTVQGYGSRKIRFKRQLRDAEIKVRRDGAPSGIPLCAHIGSAQCCCSNTLPKKEHHRITQRASHPRCWFRYISRDQEAQGDILQDSPLLELG